MVVRSIGSGEDTLTFAVRMRVLRHLFTMPELLLCPLISFYVSRRFVKGAFGRVSVSMMAATWLLLALLLILRLAKLASWLA